VRNGSRARPRTRPRARIRPRGRGSSEFRTEYLPRFGVFSKVTGGGPREFRFLLSRARRLGLKSATWVGAARQGYLAWPGPPPSQGLLRQTLSRTLQVPSLAWLRRIRPPVSPTSVVALSLDKPGFGLTEEAACPRASGLDTRIQAASRQPPGLPHLSQASEWRHPEPVEGASASALRRAQDARFG
jgi:hypothetical protein